MERENLPLWTKAQNAIWSGALDAMPPWKARLTKAVRVVLVLARDLAFGQLNLRAMSLVYTTLLSLVPLLALSFSVLKAFGVYNQLEPVLAQFLAPLGEKGHEITARVTEFVKNINVGVLGSVGLALLLYTAVSLIQKIEASLNFIWRVSQPRSIGQRFSAYLSVLLVGPLLVFSAMGLTASVMSAGIVQDVMAVEPVGRAVGFAGRLMPYLLVIGAFTFIYVFIPNTRVRPVPALAGGAVGGVLWQTAGWAFAAFAAGSTNYSAIYSGFAILILFMIWIYLSWLILLVGASVAFYLQNPEYLVLQADEPTLSNRMRERFALAIMTRVAENFVAGRAPFTLPALAQVLGVRQPAIDPVLAALRDGGVLAENSDDPPGYLPARDLDTLTVKELLSIVRCAGEDRHLCPAALHASERVDDTLRRMERAAEAELGGLTVRDLVAPSAAEEGAQPVVKKIGG
ncbi:MAG: YihY/virulence factor BrkB family protein [Pseudomonadota bacterium]